MPFALVTIGLLLVITGFQDTYKQMGLQVAKDFTGPGNFFYWVISIGVVGALGYSKHLQTFSRAIMALLIVAIFLSNKGFFTQINTSISTGSSTSVLPAGGGVPVSDSSGTAASGSGGNSVASLVGEAGSAASLATKLVSFF